MKKKTLASILTIAVLLGGIFCVASVFAPQHAFAQSPTASSTPSDSPDECLWRSSPFSPACLKNNASSFGTIILSGTSWLLWVAGICFNLSLRFTLGFKFLVNNTPGIRAAWVALRDVSNILFIFAMLYMAINTILDEGDNHKKLLRPLIIAALFINFSFFIASVIIDASNVISIGIYEAIVAPNQLVLQNDGLQTLIDASKGTPGNPGISERFVRYLSLQKLYDLKPGELNANNVQKNTGFTGIDILISIVMGIVITLVGAFVFFTGAILFLVRTVTLMFVLATAPIAFAGNIIPKLAGESKKWWKALLDQAFFAPAFLLCIYVSLYMMKNLSVYLLQGTQTNFIGLIFSYILVVGFFLASIKIANDFSASGAEAAVKYGGAASLGVAAWAGRKTIGNLANNIGQSKVGNKYLGNAISSQLRDVGSNSTFDLRNIDALGGKKIVGQGDKSGYVKYQDEYLKEKDRQAGTLGLTPYQKQVLDGRAAANKKEVTDSEKTKNDAVTAAKAAQAATITTAKTIRDNAKTDPAKNAEEAALAQKEDELQKKIEDEQKKIDSQKEAFNKASAAGNTAATVKEKAALDALLVSQQALKTQKTQVGTQKKSIYAQEHAAYDSAKAQADAEATDRIRLENERHDGLKRRLDAEAAKMATSKDIQKQAVERYAAREEKFGRGLNVLGNQVSEEQSTQAGRALKWAADLPGHILGSERMLAAAAKARERNSAKSKEKKIAEVLEEYSKEDKKPDVPPAEASAPATPPPAPKP